MNFRAADSNGKLRLLWKSPVDGRWMQLEQKLREAGKTKTYVFETGAHPHWIGEISGLALQVTGSPGRNEVHRFRLISGDIKPLNESRQLLSGKGSWISLGGQRRRARAAGDWNRGPVKVRCPEDSRLEVGMAALLPSWWNPEQELLFTATVKAGEETREVIRETLRPTRNLDDRCWLDRSADLSWCAGQTVEISLRATHQDENGNEMSGGPVWGAWHLPRFVPQTPKDDQPANLVLVVADTLRTDPIACYGNPTADTPFMDRLSTDGVLFEQALAPSSWTIPTVATLHTSKYPAEIFVVRRFYNVPPYVETLAERLSESGYLCAAITANPLVSPSLGLGQGFDFFQEHPDNCDAQELTDIALEYLRRNRGLPLFLYLHYLDPHSPYTPPEPYRQQFLPPDWRETGFEDANKFMEILNANSAELEPELRPYLSCFYNGEVAYTDDQLGRFLSELRSANLYYPSALVFVSDHGEEFFDHGGTNHGLTLFDEVIRVPLIVKPPSDQQAAGLIIREQTEITGLTSLMLNLVNVNSEGFREGTLQEVWSSALEPAASLKGEPATHSSESMAFSELHSNAQALSPPLDLFAVRTETVKLIWDEKNRSTRLYRVNVGAHDVPIPDPDSETVARLMNELTRWLDSLDIPEAQKEKFQEDSEIRERLRALGYVQ